MTQRISFALVLWFRSLVRSYDPKQYGRAPSPFIPLSFVALSLTAFAGTMVSVILWHPAPIVLIHALAVGVFLNLALGLLYQFIPVVSITRLRAQPLAYVHLACAASGTALIVYGFATTSFVYVAAGGVLYGAGFLIQSSMFALSVYGAVPPSAAAGALASLFWLLATIVLGIVMASNLARAIPPRGLAAFHATAGLAGFFGTLIAAVSLRLLRMFERVDLERVIARTTAAAHAGVLAALAGGWGRLGLLCVAVPLGVSVARIGVARKPAYQRETFYYAACSTAGALAAAVCAIANATEIAIVCALWFFIGTAVAGYLQRIVPFIWWVRRAKTQRPSAMPTLTEMNNSALGFAILAVWVAAGLFFVNDPSSRVGAGFALCAWAMLLVQLSRPFLMQRGASSAKSASNAG